MDLYLFFLVSYAFEKSQQFQKISSSFLIGAYYFKMKEKNHQKKVMNVSDFGNCLSKHSNRFLPIKLLTVLTVTSS